MFTSYSQLANGHKADVHLFNYFINKKNINGTFLEIGGFDGITYSNTYALEKYLNFKGILIEPSPSSFQKMIKNRPNCYNVQCAISNDKTEIDFVGDGTAVGGSKHILDTMVHDNKTWADQWNLNNPIVKVPAKKLKDIIKESGIKYIDFFSLDVEGGELDVLKSMDWNIPIYIIVMEVGASLVWNNASKVEECREILRKNGFKSDGKTYGLDEWWINDNYFRKDILFES